MENNEVKAISNVERKTEYTIFRRSSFRVCKTCGKFYVLNDKEALYYIDKYGTLPLRCPDCLAKIRNTHTKVENTTDDIVVE